MSSQLDLFNAVPAESIETLFDKQNQPWFKRADLGRFLGVVDIKRNFVGVMKTHTRLSISGEGPTPSRSGIRGGGKNLHDVFVDLGTALEITHRSRKPKAVKLMKWLAEKGIEKLQEEHTQLQLSIEERDLAIAILNSDLEEREREIVILEQANQDAQTEIVRLERRAVPYLEDWKNNNGMAVIQKNNGDEYPYVAICGQQGYIAQKIQNKLVDYPNGQLVVLAETPNSIVHYNWLRERRCVISNPDRVRHFRLGEHYTHQRLMELQEA